MDKEKKAYLFLNELISVEQYNKLDFIEKLGFLPVKYNNDKQRYEVDINENMQ